MSCRKKGVATSIRACVLVPASVLRKSISGSRGCLYLTSPRFNSLLTAVPKAETSMELLRFSWTSLGLRVSRIRPQHHGSERSVDGKHRHRSSQALGIRSEFLVAQSQTRVVWESSSQSTEQTSLCTPSSLPARSSAALGTSEGAFALQAQLKVASPCGTAGRRMP